jgi:hypothetical protein
VAIGEEVMKDDVRKIATGSSSAGSSAVSQAPGPDGRPFVVLSVSTPTGQAIYLLDPDCAITTGQNLRQAGRASKAGLVLPGEP